MVRPVRVAKHWTLSQLHRHPAAHFALRRTHRQVRTAAARLGLGPGPSVYDRPEIQQVWRVATHPESRPLLSARSTGPHVLFFSPHGCWATHIAWETATALALKVRGAACDFLTCAAALPTCTAEGHRRIRCKSCYPYVQDLVMPFGFPLHTLAQWALPATNGSDRVGALDLDGLIEYSYHGLELGKIVLPTVRWAMRRQTLLADLRTLDTYRAFLRGAIVLCSALPRFLDRFSYDAILCLNGYFASERVLRVLAAQRGIRVVTYERGFRPDTLFFAHDLPACQYNVDGIWPGHADHPLTPREEAVLDGYLAERFRGTRGIAGVDFWPSVEHDERMIRAQLGLDDRPIATLFTNVLFDTAVQDRDLTFASIFHWLEFTIRQFAAHPEWQLVIRIHPSEVRDVGRETEEPVADRILEAFPSLPANVKLVGPESQLSSYTLMRMSRVGLVYTTTAGLEMALMGKRSIVAGITHYRGKGFTDDAESPLHFQDLLDRRMALDEPLSAPALEMARRYAYFFFFRAQMPFDLLDEPERGKVHLRFDNLADLLPGRSAGLDAICDGILLGKDFLVE